MPVRIRAGDEIHLVVPVQEILLQVLRHAAQDTDGQFAVTTRPLVLELLQSPVDLQVGPLADRARVDQDDVGVVETIAQGVAALNEDRLHQFRVVLVHLAAVRFDVDAKIHGRFVPATVPAAGHPASTIAQRRYGDHTAGVLRCELAWR